MAQLLRDFGGVDAREEHVCTAAQKPGDIVQTPDGYFGVVMGSKDYVIGERAPITTDALVAVDSASATTITVGAAVFFNTTTRLAVASGVHPGIGGAARAKLNGELFVNVRLNRLRLPNGT
jgi:predicted RecA/RadA family phage recombinase